jgi:hypothetical protein
LTYPLDAKTTKRIVKQAAPPEVVAAIREVRYGCNRTTTQEARIVERGTIFDIRINFFLDGQRSRLISSAKKWTRPVEELGGEIDYATKTVRWTDQSARRYSAFLLLHEIAHAIYMRKRTLEGWGATKSSTEEEAWCDEFALRESKAVDLR